MWISTNGPRWGAGTLLVVSHSTRIYLYTTDAEGYYEALGWQVVDRFDWDGEPFVLMCRDLQNRS